MKTVVRRILVACLTAIFGVGPAVASAQAPSPAVVRPLEPPSSMTSLSLERMREMLERDSERTLSRPRPFVVTERVNAQPQIQHGFNSSAQRSKGGGIGRKVTGVVLAGAGVAMILSGVNKSDQAKQQLQRCDVFEEGVPGCIDTYDRQLNIGLVLTTGGIAAALVGIVFVIR